MSAINLPTPAEDMPVDYAAHVLRKLQARFDLAAVDRHSADDGQTVFSAWHTSRDGYVCYLLYTDFLVKQRIPELHAQVSTVADTYRFDVHNAFPVLTGLVVPGAAASASREYERAGFDLPLIIVPVPVQFVNV